MADNEEKQVDTVEDKAREMGWKPQDEYEGDEEKWVNADIFVARKPLFDKIEQEKRSRISMERQLAETNKALKELGEHNKKVAEVAYKRAKAELLAAKKDALREGEHVMAEEIQERIDELKPEDVPEVPVYNPNKVKLDAWVAENKWYAENVEMRNVADGIAITAIAQGKGIDEIFELIGTKMRKMYAEEFGVTEKSKEKDAPHVESRTAAGGKKASRFHPTEEQAKFARAFVQQGVFKSVDEYYKQLAELGD